VARIWLPHPKLIYGAFGSGERQFSHALEDFMIPVFRSAIVAVGVLLWTTAPGMAQRVHEIRLEANPDKDVYRFAPAQVSARPGDVLLFKVASGSPHSIVFEGANLSETARAALNGAMSRRSADLSSPLLTADGTEYRIVVPAIATGRYGFFCLPHRAYDMRGELLITK
jgi:plastocyanin